MALITPRTGFVNTLKPPVIDQGLVIVEFFDGAFHVMTPDGTVQRFSTVRAVQAHAKKWGKAHTERQDAINILRIDWRGKAAHLAKQAGIQ